jgi:predicted lipoprotein with Yx(FWY)xxD motif
MRASPKVMVVGGMLGVAALLAGCGGGSQKSSPTTTTSSSGSAGKPSTSFSTAKVSGLGTVVVDGRGRTVYVLTADGKTNAPCTDQNGCTKLWPDLPLPDGSAGAKGEMGIDSSLLGTKKLSDGETYPTYHGWLMYEYSGDSGPGQSNGQGIKSFGGTWYALKASGSPVTSGGGGGGGYP